MRKATSMMAQWKAQTKSGESLRFENCKGGCVSNKDEYGLRVIGKTVQDGEPSPSSPVPIQCVKAGTKIICRNIIITPCDLYEGDIWYPISGRVVRINKIKTYNGTEAWWRSSDDTYWGAWGQEASKYNGGDTQKFTHYIQTIGYVSIAGRAKVQPNGAIVLMGKPYGCETAEELKAALRNNPFTAVYEKATPTIEQYTPQSCCLSSGTVNVTQEPQEIPAELRMTHLVRR